MGTGQIKLVDVKVEIEEAQRALSGTSKSLKSIQKSVLRIAAQKTLKAVKTALQSSDLDLNSGTGELKKAYTYRVKKDGSEANVYPKALNAKRNKGGAINWATDAIFPKAMALSYGHSGPTKRAKSWFIAPRNFVQAGDLYAESGKYMDEVQKYIDKELDKYWS